ncbi:NAD(P)H-dependent oxidoreductase [Paenibacillus pasadenensis]|uniref:NAD(P)H-dependent oxidoreductase n=1 Tax=Paenibacillus pasadenensis TaxID=217090 RepID=UPI00203D3E91|nr:NAD(P)H-dependent oxidoreductase [Paenibacillus pasadenensis]MCM3746935.1 NAD(P)H-dependent oxidoreductase [Paenibacillus pasadenensis]
MKKTLVVVTHPNMETSIINKRWVEELRKYPDKYTVHELYKAYPDEKFDVEKEQQLIEEHGNLVLQFPMYWASSPPLLKKWFDEVLTHGWAYGSQGKAFKDKKTALAISLGAEEIDFSKEGIVGHELDEILLPFKVNFKFCHADYHPPFTFFSAEYTMAQNTDLLSKLERSAGDYVEFLDKL